MCCAEIIANELFYLIGPMANTRLASESRSSCGDTFNQPSQILGRTFQEVASPEAKAVTEDCYSTQFH